MIESQDRTLKLQPASEVLKINPEEARLIALFRACNPSQQDAILTGASRFKAQSAVDMGVAR